MLTGLGEFTDIPNSSQNRFENKQVCKNTVTRVQVAHSRLWAPRRFSRDNRTTLGSLSGDVFERRMSTGSEPFSLLINLDTTKFVLLSVFTLKETICPRIWSKSRPKSAKRPLPVDICRSKTSLLKLPTARRSKYQLDQWQSGKLSTGSRVTSVALHCRAGNRKMKQILPVHPLL